MNLEGDEMHKITVNLDDRLTKEDPLSILISPLLELVKIPNLGGVLDSFSNFLPQNLTQIAQDGVATLLNPEQLSQVIQEGVQSATGTLQQQITDKLNEIMSIANEATDAVEDAQQALVSAGAALASLNLGYLNKTLTQFLNTFNITGTDLTSIANVQSAANSVISSLENLSPSQIRDLFNPEKYQQIFNETLQAAQNVLGTEAINNALQSIAPSLNINSLNQLAQSSVALFNNSAGGGPEGPGGGRQYELLAEVHVYYAQGDGADSDAAQHKSVSGQALQPGVSCAVDNSTILLGSTVITSLGTFKAVDKCKIGSTSGLPPVNLFFEDIETAAMKTYELSSSKKAKQIVKVIPPGGGYSSRNLEKRGLDYDLY